METKYNIKDKVLIEAEVIQIRMDNEGISYLVKPTAMHDIGVPRAYLKQEIFEDDIKGMLLEAEE